MNILPEILGWRLNGRERRPAARFPARLPRLVVPAATIAGRRADGKRAGASGPHSAGARTTAQRLMPLCAR